MPVPGLQKILLPLLSFFASDGRNHTVDEAVEAMRLSSSFHLGTERSRCAVEKKDSRKMSPGPDTVHFRGWEYWNVEERGCSELPGWGFCFWRFDRVFPVGGGQKRIVLIDKPFVGRWPHRAPTGGRI